MSISIAKYSVTSLPGVNAVNKLKPDATGYYRCIVGGFNIMSRNGVFYPLTQQVLSLFAEDSILRRRLTDGYCRAEYGHPNILGMEVRDILRRLCIIEEKNACATYRKFDLVESKDEFGKPIILVYGELLPSGPYGDVLTKQLNNNEENVAFSVRSITNDYHERGIYCKEIKNLVTYDYVNEPGIKRANQFNTAVGLESLQDILFTENDLAEALRFSQFTGMESEQTQITMIKDSLGWHKIQSVNLGALGWR